MVGADAGVDDGDGHARALALVPGGDGVDVVAGVPGLPEILWPVFCKRPQRAEAGIVRDARQVHPAIGLGGDDVVVGAQRGERLAGVSALTSSVRSRASGPTSSTPASARSSARSARSRPGTRWTMMSPSAACAEAGTAKKTASAVMTSERITCLIGSRITNLSVRLLTRPLDKFISG